MKKKLLFAGIFGVAIIGIAAVAYSYLVDDRTSQVKVCPVHEQPLRTEIAKISYGLPKDPVYPEGYVEAVQAEFPNCQDFCWGGCSVRRQIWAWASFCPKCRAAKAGWLAQHSGD